MTVTSVGGLEEYIAQIKPERITLQTKGEMEGRFSVLDLNLSFDSLECCAIGWSICLSSINGSKAIIDFVRNVKIIPMRDGVSLLLCTCGAGKKPQKVSFILEYKNHVV